MMLKGYMKDEQNTMNNCFTEDLRAQAANDSQDMGEEKPDSILSKVENAMQHMKTRKSLGLNDIPAELIKSTGQNCAKYFLGLCNTIWKT